MRVNRQRCQSCGSLDVHNLLVREEGSPQTVLVRCTQCTALVARYVLADYMHLGKGLESFLRSHRSAVAESGRRISEDFEEAERSALEAYARALDALEDAGKEP